MRLPCRSASYSVRLPVRGFVPLTTREPQLRCSRGHSRIRIDRHTTSRVARGCWPRSASPSARLPLGSGFGSRHFSAANTEIRTYPRSPILRSSAPPLVAFTSSGSHPFGVELFVGSPFGLPPVWPRPGRYVTAAPLPPLGPGCAQRAGDSTRFTALRLCCSPPGVDFRHFGRFEFLWGTLSPSPLFAHGRLDRRAVLWFLSRSASLGRVD